MMLTLNKSIQVVIALGVALLLNYIALQIMEKEEIIEVVGKNEISPIFKGWVETKSFTNKKFDTQNRFAKNYKKLPRSVNKRGGAQFSYSVWVRFSDISASNLSKKILFLQGDRTKYPYTVTLGNKSFNKNEFVIKCPLVRFGDDINQLVVEFNTSQDVCATAVISKNESSDESIRHNVFSLIPDKWTLFTFVFEDSREFGEHEDGFEFRFFVNDIQYFKNKYKGMLRLNQGNISILPDSTIEGGYMADLTYYNYALSLEDVRRIMARGVSKERYNEMEGDPSFHEPLYLSEYNKLEIYNI